MSDGNDESADAIDCEVLAEAGGSQVVILRCVCEAFASLEVKNRARFVRIMEQWCEGARLLPKMFNPNEGRSSQRNLLIQAFKAFKVRLYGISRAVSGKRTFIIVEIDPAKKQDKADPIVLKRAKKRADEIGKGN